jgi:hypothetical protein
MFDLIRRYKLKKVFHNYLHQLGPELPRRYGMLDQYTVLQIEATAGVLKLSSQYLPYAIALYRHEESVNTIERHNISQEFLNILRAEIADAIFDGDTDFSASESIKAGSSYGWKGGRPNGYVTSQAVWHTFGSER